MTHNLLFDNSQQTQAHLETDSPLFNKAFEAFRDSYPAFLTTSKLDDLRATDYARLDRQGHVYLDYTGGGLYAESR